MVGMKMVVLVLGKSTLNKENIFYGLRLQLHYRLPVLVLLMTIVLALYISFIIKKMSEQHLPIHPRERLPLPAVPILDTSPKLDLQSGRLFFHNTSLNIGLLVSVSISGRYKHLPSLLRTIIEKVKTSI